MTSEHGTLVRLWIECILPSKLESDEITAGTLHCYKRQAERWLLYLGDNRKPTARTVYTWLSHLRDSGLSLSTIQTYLAALKAMYRWASHSGRYRDIARDCKVPHAKPCVRKRPSANDVADLFVSLPSSTEKEARDKALFALMYSTAIMVDAVVRLRVCDVNFVTGVLTHKRLGRFSRKIPSVETTLSNAAIDALEKYLSFKVCVAADPLFTNVCIRYKNMPRKMSTRGIRGIILSKWEERGFVQRDSLGHVVNVGVFSGLSLRRSAAMLVASRFGVVAARDLVKHASVESTRRLSACVNTNAKSADIAALLNL